MAKLKSIKTDSKKSAEGIWFDYEMGIRLRIARMGNKDFEEFVRSKQKTNIKGFRAKKITEEQAEAITQEAVARHVLVGWENIEDDDGNPIPYSHEVALEFLNDPDLSDLRQFVLIQASDSESYRLEAIEEAEEN